MQNCRHNSKPPPLRGCLKTNCFDTAPIILFDNSAVEKLTDSAVDVIHELAGILTSDDKLATVFEGD